MHGQSDKWQVSSMQKLIICARILLPGTDLPDMCSESRIQMEAWHVWIEMAMRIIITNTYTYTHTHICVRVHICAHLYRGSPLRGLVKGRRDLNFSMQESVSEFLPFVVCNTGIRLQGTSTQCKSGPILTEGACPEAHSHMLFCGKLFHTASREKGSPCQDPGCQLWG